MGLHSHCTLSAFPRLVDVFVAPRWHRQAPVSLLSLVARPHVRRLVLGNTTTLPPTINLADLFVGGVRPTSVALFDLL